MTYLFDVNVLIALLWPGHALHPAARAWFVAHKGLNWATCALTQAGFVRVSAQGLWTGSTRDIGFIHALLHQSTQSPLHRFMPLDFDFDTVRAHCTGGLVGHRQVTDAYLLTLAVRNGTKLVTFDAGLPHLLATVAERAQHVELLTAP
jgi:uncharacterized protein